MDSKSRGEKVPYRQGSITPRDLVEGGLLCIGIPAVTLYPLGFIALGVQLWRDPSFPYHDFTTIWEAVSLIPQRVVVATGIRLIYTSLLATILGAAVAGLFFELLLWRNKSTGEEGGRDRLPRSNHRWSIPLLLLLPLMVSPLLIRGDLPIDSRHDYDALYVTGFFVFALVGEGYSIL